MRKWDLGTKTHNKLKSIRWHIWYGFVIVKSLGKYEQRYLNVSAIIVVISLLTRLPMKQGERPMVSAYYESNKVLGYPTAIFDCIVGSGSYIGVIILFFINGIITPNSL